MKKKKNSSNRRITILCRFIFHCDFICKILFLDAVGSSSEAQKWLKLRTKFHDGDGATKAEAETEAGGGRVTSMVGYHGTLVAQAIATSKKKSNGSAKVCHAGSPSPTAISLKETGNFLAAQQFHIGAESIFKVANLI